MRQVTLIIEFLAVLAAAVIVCHGSAHAGKLPSISVRLRLVDQQDLDQRVRRVVTAGGLAFMAGSRLEFEGAGFLVQLGMQLQQ